MALITFAEALHALDSPINQRRISPLARLGPLCAGPFPSPSDKIISDE